LRAKQAELLRDLSKVLTKYSARDWEPLVRLLSGSKSKFEAVVALLDDLDHQPPSAKDVIKKNQERSHRPKVGKTKKQKGPSKATKPELAKGRSGKASRPPATELLPDRILGRVSTGQLRSLYRGVFRSKQVPEARATMIAELSKYLRKQPEESRAAILISLSRRSDDAVENYRRWARIISTPLRARSK
jgi:hypothetical protein